MSSLKDQLSQIASQTQGIALDRKKRQKIHSASLIFAPKVASAQDFEFIYDHTHEHFLELCSIDSRFEAFSNSLFAESSINLDRNTLSDEENKDLNTNINMFLLLASGKWHLSSTMYAMEWLVRRFQIHLHNVEYLIFCSIQHYQTTIFKKILNITKLPNNYSVPLGPFQRLENPTPNSSSLLKLFYDFEIRNNYFKYISKLLKHKLGSQSVYTFICVLSINLVSTYPNILQELIPGVLEISAKLLACKDSTWNEAQTAAHTMLLVLSKVDLNETIVFAAVETILTNLRSSSNIQKSGFITIGSLLQSLTGETKQFSLKLYKLIKEKYGSTISYYINTQELPINKLIIAYIRSIIRYDFQEGLENVIEVLKSSKNLSTFEKKSIIFDLINLSEIVNDKSILAPVFVYLISINELLVVECLSSLNISPEIFEIRLTTSLFNDSDKMGSDNAEEVLKKINSSKVIGAMTEVEPYKQWESKNSQYIFTKKESLLATKSSDFNKLLSLFVEALGKKYSTKQFLESFFTNFESRITFLIRVLASPAAPSALKLLIVENLTRITGSISKDVNLFTLVPVLVCSLEDKSKAVKEAVCKYLRNHVLKRCLNENFFMLNSIYGDNKKISVFEPKHCDKWLRYFLDNYFVDSESLSEFCIIKKTESMDIAFWADQCQTNDLKFCLSTILKIITSYKHYNSTYSELLTPILQKYLENRETIKTICIEEKTNFNEVEQNIVNIVSKNEKNEENINFLISALNSDSETLSNIVINRLLKIFTSLKFNTKIKIINNIVDITAKNPELLNYDSLSLLQTLNIDCDVFASILNFNKITMDESEDVQQQHLLKKRRRRSSASVKNALQKDEVTQLAEIHLKKITIVIEAIDGNKNLKNINEQFLAAMFNHLNDLETLDNDGGLPILYAQEILCSCLLKSINLLKEQQQQTQKQKTKLHSLRPDILVSAIRSSPSPQVQNKLLMVISALASLSPEIILHSVMPIFTFMGSHSIKQDDEFTTNVVQNTIKAVIPALLNNSQNKQQEIEFLLSSFVAAFNHVPKHRRVKLFTTLVQTLNAENSIPPFLFLIGEQYYNANNNFKLAEGKEIITFVKNFTNNFSAEQQLKSILEFLNLIKILPIITSSSHDNAEVLKKVKSDMLKRSLFSSNILRMNEPEFINFRKSLLNFLSGIISETDADYYNNGSLKLRIMGSLLEGNENIKQIVSTITKSVLEMINEIDHHLSNIKIKPVKVNKKLLKAKRQSSSATSSSKSGSEDNELSKHEIISDCKTVLFEILSDVLALLTINDYTEAVIPLMSNEQDEQIRYHLTLKLSKRFSYEPVGETVEIINKVIEVLFANLADTTSSSEIIYVSLNALSFAINKYKETLAPILPKALEIAVEKLNGEFNDSVAIASLSVINICIQLLGIKSIQYYSKIVPKALSISDDLQNETLVIKNKLVKEELQLSVLLLFATILKKIPMFATSNLQAILISIMYSYNVKEEIRLNIIKILLENVDLKEVLIRLYKIWQVGTFTTSTDKPNGIQSMALSIYLSTLEKAVELMDKKTCKLQAATFFKLLINLFEFRSYSSFDNNSINKIESMVHTIAHNFILKINDQMFRPLFAFLVKWAFLGENAVNKEMSRNDRLIQFFKLFNKLQEQLRSILTSYFTYILDETNELLLSMTEDYDVKNINLRRLIIIGFGLSFKYDKDEYWRSSSRFEMVCPTIISQLKNIEPPLGKYLAKTIGALAQCNSMAEEHNKIMQKEIMKHMKVNCRSNEKLWAIRSIKLIYAKVGESWLILLPQLVPIVAELLEDDDETIEAEVRTGLVRVFENVLGEPFDKYLD
ncbi:hypothetical protein ACO0SA_003334 [Hanseniaspora valbyensis]